MPPSGYKQKQSKFITDFMDSCFNELLKEANELDLSLKQALVREISNIVFAVNSDVYGSSANLLMLLTQEFYKNILDSVNSGNFNGDISRILQSIEKQILEIDTQQLLSQNTKLNKNA